MKNFKFKKMKTKKEEEKGITLVALVVTIVVLLILAGVSINLILSNSGIINKSTEAKEKYGQAKENEQTDLDDAADWIDQWATGVSKPIKVEVDSKATANGTINGKKATSNNPIIPEGYTPIDTDTSSWGDGSSAPAQADVDQGLVITDDSGNEWVWIPVEDVTVMCDTSNTIEYTLAGTESVKTKWYSRAIRIENDNTTSTNPYTTSTNPYTVYLDNPYSSETGGAGPRGIPGDTNRYREPDLFPKTYDEKNYGLLGFGSMEKMAEAFVTDYNEMIESISRYGGFYVGRYELSSVGVQKNQDSLINKNWYELYDTCRNLNASDKVKTRMIWGCQWDMVCNYIANKGDKKNVWDSRSWGNYYDSIEPANGGNYNGNGEVVATGSNETWKANNIYDIAGNCAELTQEATEKGRMSRGGSAQNIACSGNNGIYSGSAASRRGWWTPEESYYILTSRPTLIVK